MFYLNSILLGAGLAMDAFSVSLANGMNEPLMSWKKVGIIAVIFGIFQGVMPLVGWMCVHTVLRLFSSLEKFIPFIALGLLLMLGIKMLYDGLKTKNDDNAIVELSIGTILIQGVATSIDALSVGFTIASHTTLMAVITSCIITLVTTILCFIGVAIGRKFGVAFKNKASIIGGIILIAIGIEIFVTSFIS